ncbi:hypothetical protein D3C76_1663870 [compost metagenome]
MDADVALIEMGDYCLWQRARMLCWVDKLGINRLFAHQDSDARALRFIVLTGNVQDISPDDGAGF